MDCYFYNTSDDYRVLNKTLTQVGSVADVTFKHAGDLNLKNPTIVWKMGSAGSGFPDVKTKMFYLPDLRRYFYVTNVVSINTQIKEITGIIDYLTTWKNSILSSTVTANHSTSAGNAFLPDTIPVQCKKIINYKPFSGASSSSISVWGSDNVADSTKSILLTCI